MKPKYPRPETPTLQPQISSFIIAISRGPYVWVPKTTMTSYSLAFRFAAHQREFPLSSLGLAAETALHSGQRDSSQQPWQQPRGGFRQPPLAGLDEVDGQGSRSYRKHPETEIQAVAVAEGPCSLAWRLLGHFQLGGEDGEG